MWHDGALFCNRVDADGELIAQVARNARDDWAAFDTLKLNPEGNGYLKVKAGFPTAAAAKAFVDECIANEGWHA